MRQEDKSKKESRSVPRLAAMWVVLLLLAVATKIGCKKNPAGSHVADAGITYDEDVVAIIRKECSDCHRPDGGAPFSLLSYNDVAKRSTQIAEVTASGYMPPWPPDADANAFIGERSLSDQQIQTLKNWSESGAREGTSASQRTGRIELEPRGWSLGTPDLVVSLDEPFEMPADAPDDIYRNFVASIPVQASTFVNAIEIRPTNLRVAHHLFVRVDKTGAARALAMKDELPGFAGMERPFGVRAPDGCILSWQVGKQATREPEGVAWRLDPGSDFVIECHLQPTGKPESVDIEIGLFFTDKPPKRFPFLLNLRQLNIDIGAGDSNHRVSMAYSLPVEAIATAVLPHAHYLGRTLNGYAILPSGTRQTLVNIPHWNFNWQGEYRYKDPPVLPAGTKIVMDYLFDNSKDNPLNPNHPPERVKYGPQSTDEMSELAVQLIPNSKSDHRLLEQHFNRWRLENESIPYHMRRVADRELAGTDRYESQLSLGKALLALGKGNQAFGYLKDAANSRHATAEVYYFLGRMYVMKDYRQKAGALFRQGLSLDPNHADTLNGLGLIALQSKRSDEAVDYFEKAIRSQPRDSTFHYNLGLGHLERRDTVAALAAFEEALEIEPSNQKAEQAIKTLRK